MIQVTTDVPKNETVILAHKKLSVEALRIVDGPIRFVAFFRASQVVHGVIADEASEHQLCFARIVHPVHHNIELSGD